MSGNNRYFQNLLERRIFPTPHEKEHLGEVIDRMTAFMHNNELLVSETIVGGSYGKNTMIKGRSEVDIVYVLSSRGVSYSYNDLIGSLLVFANGEFNQNDIEENTYGCTIEYRAVQIDLLITRLFDSPSIFLNQNLNTRVYKPYRIKLQHDFAIERGTIYQNLVRLLKYWRNLGIQAQWKPLKNLKSFLIELLAAEVFDSSDHQNSYGDLLKEFFTQTDEVLTSQDQIYFDDYYDEEQAIEFTSWTVNDPADPSYNVVPNNLDLEKFQNYLRFSKNRANREDWSSIFNYG